MHDKNLSIKGPARLVTWHRPGIRDGYYEPGDFAILDKDGHLVGDAYDRIGPIRFANAKANAILWAAAPELLEACEVAFMMISELVAESIEAGFAVSESEKHLEILLNNAIFKARGETQGE